MRDLNHDFKKLVRRNRDGSFATQHDREVILTLIANQLHEGGFGICAPRACALNMSNTSFSVGTTRVSARALSRTG